MFPQGSAQEFLDLSGDEQFHVMEVQRKFALDFILSSRHSLLRDDSAIDALSEKVFWKSCVRLEPNHIKTILRLYPYVDRMLAKYGIDSERNLDLFLNSMTTLLLGCEYSIELRNVLPTQIEAIFGTLDRQHREREQRMKMEKPSWATPLVSDNGDRE
jgi:hypothetical protein